MKYVRTYESFKKEDKVNEEFIGSLLAAAKGAFKSFLTGISAPFKAIKDDFKKGLKMEELKIKITTMLDTLLKTSTDSINKAEDETMLNQIADQFRKEFSEKCAEIDNEIKTIKESKMINESVKDSMVAGRVLLGMIKQKSLELKMEYDKKFAAAKDLAGKKIARIDEIKAIVNDFKKKVTDDKYIEEQIKKYKTENKIESSGGGEGVIILDWGDVEIEVKKVEKGYQVTKSGSKKLIVKDGEELIVSISGEVKKGEKVKLTNIMRAGKPDTLTEYETGSLERIVVDGKEVDSHKFEESEKAEGQEDLVKKLGDLKQKNPEAIAKIGNIASLYNDPEANKEKIAEIEKQL